MRRSRYLAKRKFISEISVSAHIVRGFIYLFLLFSLQRLTNKFYIVYDALGDVVVFQRVQRGDTKNTGRILMFNCLYLFKTTLCFMWGGKFISRIKRQFHHKHLTRTWASADNFAAGSRPTMR